MSARCRMLARGRTSAVAGQSSCRLVFPEIRDDALGSANGPAGFQGGPAPDVSHRAPGGAAQADPLVACVRLPRALPVLGVPHRDLQVHGAADPAGAAAGQAPGLHEPDRSVILYFKVAAVAA